MIIKHTSVPPWPIDDLNRYFRSYKSIIDNFERSCSIDNVLFIDNTYLDGETVVRLLQGQEYAVIFNMLDPPYTWHYLDKLLEKSGCKIIMVGTDAPDLPVHFWLIHAFLEFPDYSLDEMKFQPTKDPLVFLNYNNKPNSYRKRLIEHLQARDLLSYGHVTFNCEVVRPTRVHDDDLAIDRQISSTMARDIGFGNINIWRNHFLNVTSETVFRIHPELVFSEKPIKPILGLRPFIVNGSPRYYEVLRSMEFDVFDDIFPVEELCAPSQDLDQLMTRNHNVICDTIENLLDKDLVKFYDELWPRLLYNHQRMRHLMETEFQRLCVNPVTLPWRQK